MATLATPLLRVSLLLLVAAVLRLPAADAAKFSCTGTGAAGRCHALLGYTPTNDTTLGDVRALFQVRSFRALLAANGLPLSVPASRRVPAGSTVRVRFPCACSAGSGAYAGGRPVYTIGPGNALDAIARGVFNGLVTYQDIAAANNIGDPDRIVVGQRLWIPLPCSCDRVDGRAVLHYAHVVAAGSTVDEIASEFGTTNQTLMMLNNISDPNTLQAGQVLDVPLRACSSSISNTSLDHDLRVPNGSYILTANNCIRCSCSSSSWQLDCLPTEGISSSTCPAATCGSINLGNLSSSSVCEAQACVYTGYTNTTSFKILTNLTTQTLCSTAGAPLPEPNNGSGRRSRTRWSSFLLLSILHMALLQFGYAW